MNGSLVPGDETESGKRWGGVNDEPTLSWNSDSMGKSGSAWGLSVQDHSDVLSRPEDIRAESGEEGEREMRRPPDQREPSRMSVGSTRVPGQIAIHHHKAIEQNDGSSRRGETRRNCAPETFLEK